MLKNTHDPDYKKIQHTVLLPVNLTSEKKIGKKDQW